MFAEAQICLHMLVLAGLVCSRRELHLFFKSYPARIPPGSASGGALGEHHQWLQLAQQHCCSTLLADLVLLPMPSQQCFLSTCFYLLSCLRCACRCPAMQTLMSTSQSSLLLKIALVGAASVPTSLPKPRWLHLTTAKPSSPVTARAPASRRCVPLPALASALQAAPARPWTARLRLARSATLRTTLSGRLHLPDRVSNAASCRAVMADTPQKASAAHLT